MEDWVGNLAREQVVSLIGAERFQAALEQVELGRLGGLLTYPDASISARWTDWQSRFEMKIGNLEKGIGVTCTCRQNRPGELCEHLVALLAAWVTAPESFGTLNDQPQPAFAPAMPPRPTQAGLPQDMVQEYRELLNGCTVQKLREIARLRGVPITGVRKEAITDVLAKALATAVDFKTIWESLTPDARLVLGLFEFCQLAWGIVLFETIKKTARDFAHLTEGRVTAALNALRQYGLVFGEVEDGFKCPSSVLASLPAILDFAPKYQGKLAHPHDAQRPASFSRVFIRLLLFLQAGENQFRSRQVETHPLEKKLPDLRGWPHDIKEMIALSRERSPAQALWSYKLRLAPLASLLEDDAMQRLSQTLHLSQEQLDFMVRLAAKAGWVAAKPGRPLEIRPERLSSLVEDKTGESAARLFNLYFGLDSWTELDLAIRANPAFALRHIPGYRGAYNQMLQTLAEARHSLMQLLRRAPVGLWVDFAGMVTQAGYLPLIRSPWTSARYWFLEVKGRALHPEKTEDWQMAYTHFAESIIAGPLHWQGLVDVAWQNGRLAAFRLNELGAGVIGGLPIPIILEVPQSSALEFSEQGGLVLHPEAATASLQHLWLLFGAAKITQTGDLVYQPDTNGIGRAFKAGWTVEQITRVLEEAARQPLPAALAEALQTWWNNFGKVSLYQDVALVEFSDDYALTELLAGTSFGQHLLYQFSPRLVAIRPEGAQLLYEDLARRGYTPRMQG